MHLFPTRQIFLEIGPLAIHWYGVMYLLAFLLAWWMIPVLARKRNINLTKEDVSNLLFAGILGVIIGGRLGYVIFYAPEYFGRNPLEIFAVWKGGMSSHGGMIGVAVSLLILIKTRKCEMLNAKCEINLFQLGDLIVVPIALGLALGRFGNFINLELYGPTSALPWAIAIPGVEGLRHPTMLYAMGKNLLIAIICFTFLMKSKRAGTTTGVFFVLYGLFRFIVEFVRIETAAGLDILGIHLTRGQLLTIPIVLIGIYILFLRHKRSVKVESLPFSTASDDDLQSILKKHSIGLTVDEARKVSGILGRDPTVVEATIWGIQGSEHCSYRSSSKFLKSLPTKGRHVILGPGEDSGIVAITDWSEGKRWGVVASHESHNHPSQIVPYEGAATGVGGIVRDVLCMGARVIGTLDPLRLGDLKTEESKTIAKEVVRGIAGYGNPLGIPNLGGDTEFDEGYNSNCLVNVVCFGLVREDEILHSYAPEEAGEVGYDIIIVGKPTDRSGFGGASFASLTLEEEEKDKNTGAVQEPNPFLERHLLASTYALFDWLAAEGKLEKVGFKDLGAGGVVCASVEQVSDRGMGAEVDLDKVHVAMDDLPPEVIACAETQERFCWTCHPSLTKHILEHYNKTWDLPSIAENARASVVGKVHKDPVFKLKYKGEVVCEAKAKDITCGLTYERQLKERVRNLSEPSLGDVDVKETFLKILSHPNYASKAPIFRHYDKNVIGNTVLEPGEADSGVIAPLQNLESYVHEGMHPGWGEASQVGVAVSCAGRGRLGKISPYFQGVNAVAEALRNVAATGATPRALTDCLNYGNPEIPEEMWEFSEGVRGIAEAAKGIKVDGDLVPIISGNVSLYNSTPEGPIPPTSVVSCIGVIDDVKKAVPSIITEPDQMIFMLGDRKDECGGSAFYEVNGELGANIPKPDFDEVSKQIKFITEAIDQGLITACHDISDGGLMLALFEMLTPLRRQTPKVGMGIDLSNIKSDLPIEKVMFSETGGFAIAVGALHATPLRQTSEKHGVKIHEIGKTTNDLKLDIKDVYSLDLPETIEIWQKPLEEILGL